MNTIIYMIVVVMSAREKRLIPSSTYYMGMLIIHIHILKRSQSLSIMSPMATRGRADIAADSKIVPMTGSFPLIKTNLEESI